MEVLLTWVKNMDTKQQIRKRIRTLRKEMNPDEVCKKSGRIAEQVLHTTAFKEAELVLLYADFQNEVQTGLLAEESWKAGKRVAYPKVVGNEMEFYLISEYAQLTPGAMNIPEPATDCEKIISFPENTLMIMPGVAFDENLNRVGYGGGYYDRFLDKHPDLVRIAISYELQLCDNIPVEPTDYKPHMLITEKEILTAEN